MRQTVHIWVRVSGGGHITTTCSRNVIILYFGLFWLLLPLCFFILAGCGNDNSGSESKKYTSRDSIKIDGETASESYVKISSAVEGEAAVSVTNGGHLTLHDATIWKIGDEESGSPTFGMAGARGDRPPDAGNPGPPPEAGDPGPPPEAGGRELSAAPPVWGGGDVPDSGTPGGVLAGGLRPAEGLPADTNPGPAATHAGVYAGSGASVSLENVCIETAVGEGSGLYASGQGSSISLVNGTITTDGSTAHGVLVTHQGAVSVENVTIITKGEHSSALATFKGNGTVTAVGGTYTAFGEYSAGIYSAGDVCVTGVVCKSISDNAAVLDGGSSITLKDSVLWAKENRGVMIFQSISSDVPVGPSKFEMTGGSISADDGPIFYVTNTSGSIFLKQVDLYGSSGILLKVLKGEWDTDVAWAKPVQGGIIMLVAENQNLPGDIIVDEFSKLDTTLKNGTTLTGAINADNHGKDVRLTLDATSTWHVTADSYLTMLTFYDGVSDAGITNIFSNGHTVYYSKDASPALGGKIYELPEGGKLMPN